MGWFVFYITGTGQVVSNGYVEDADASLAVAPGGQTKLNLAGPPPANVFDTYYVTGGVLTQRSAFTATVTPTTIDADGADAAVFSSLPDPCTVTVTGPASSTATVTGGTLSFTCTTEGTYFLTFSKEPSYMPRTYAIVGA